MGVEQVFEAQDIFTVLKGCDVIKCIKKNSSADRRVQSFGCKVLGGGEKPHH